MTRDQSAAYIYAQSVCALAEIEGMRAFNTIIQIAGGMPIHDEQHFAAVPEKYGISRDQVLALFEGAED